MWNSRFCGTVSSFLTLAACALLAACGEDEGGEGDKSRVETDTSTLSSAASKSTIVIQMTGLLLIVPQTTAGKDVSVVLPQPGALEKHVAWFGVGIAEGEADYNALCDSATFAQRARKAGICYVNLAQWTLQPVGTGGSPTPSLQEISTAHPGLLNVTHLSGSTHRVHHAHLGNRSLTEVVLVSGQPDSTSCRLATWTYNVQGEAQAKHLPLTNVLNWKVEVNAPSALIFKSRSTSRVISVPIPAGETKVLLAHIPEDEIEHLPAENTNTAQIADTVTVARHFSAYYDQLSRGAPPEWISEDSPLRKIPVRTEGETPQSQPCRVEITLRTALLPAFASLATYACMPALGEFGS
jgi:hypothetical protein